MNAIISLSLILAPDYSKRESKEIPYSVAVMNLYILTFTWMFLAFTSYGQTTPEDSIVREVEAVLPYAIRRYDLNDDGPVLVQAANRARQKIVELGSRADLAVAAIIVRGLKAKREHAILNAERKRNWSNNPAPIAPESPTVARLGAFILFVRNDPALVPILKRPLWIWWNEFVEGAAFSFSSAEEEAALYLYRWGSENERQHIIHQAEVLATSGNPNLAAIGSSLQGEMKSPRRRLYPPPKGPFHEWCREILELDGQLLPPPIEQDAHVPAKPIPLHSSSQPEEPKSAVATTVASQSNDKTRMIWLFIVISLALGGFWVISRRSK